MTGFPLNIAKAEDVKICLINHYESGSFKCLRCPKDRQWYCFATMAFCGKADSRLDEVHDRAVKENNLADNYKEWNTPE